MEVLRDTRERVKLLHTGKVGELVLAVSKEGSTGLVCKGARCVQRSGTIVGLKLVAPLTNPLHPQQVEQSKEVRGAGEEVKAVTKYSESSFREHSGGAADAVDRQT